MNVKTAAVKTLFSDKYSQEIFCEFYTFCLRYSRYFFCSTSWYTLLKKNNLPYSLQEISTSLIGPLFARDQNNQFYKIQNYFKKNCENINSLSEAEIVYLLKSLIRNCIKQNICFFLAEIDPQYEKVLRNVKRVLREIPGICIKENSVITGNLTDAYAADEYIDSVDQNELLRTEFYNRCNGEISTKELIQTVLDIHKEIFPRQKFIDINKIVLLIKERRKLYTETDIKNTGETGKTVEIKIIIENVMNNIHTFLENKYYRTKKLNKNETIMLEECLNRYLFDLIVQNSTKKYYEYFNDIDTEMTKNEYREKYKNIFEYIVRSSKTEISKAIKKDFHQNL